MITYTTCRDCGELLHVENQDQNVHDNCSPKPTKAERLSQQWLDAVMSGNGPLEHQLFTQIEELDNQPPRMLDAAILYSSWGWPVFPLRAQDKRPATRNGFKDATTDQERIKAWWTQFPNHNIGLPTGINFDVIDVDVPEGALTYVKFVNDDMLPEIHGHAATSSGGLHLYTEPTGDGNGVRIRPGIDYRGVGGYVVAPPSTLGQRGRSWSWVSHPSPAIKKAPQK